MVSSTQNLWTETETHDMIEETENETNDTSDGSVFVTDDEDTDSVRSSDSSASLEADGQNLHKRMMSIGNNPTEIQQLHKALGEWNGNINAHDSNGQTLLHIAARRGLLSTCSLLCDRGGDIHRNDYEQRQPLHLACREGHKSIADFLLQQGAEVEAEDYLDARPLHEACSAGHLKVVQLLLSRDPPAEVNAVKIGGYSPLILAVLFGQDAVFDLLLSKKDVELGKVTKRFGGFTALHWAAFLGKKTMVRKLLNQNADFTSQNEVGWTPLFAATYGEKAEAMKELLNPSPNGMLDMLEVPGGGGLTPLLQACRDGFTEGAQIMIEASAKCNARSDLHETPLIEASKGGYKAIVELLLPKLGKEEIDMHDKSKRTALHVACEKRQEEVARLLMSQGAKCDTQSDSTSTPLMEASFQGLEAVVDDILEKVTTQTINLPDKLGRSALHMACDQGHVEVVKALLSKEADFNLRDSQGMECLHLASMNGSTPIVRLLLNHGANIGSEDGSRHTPLHYAFQAGGMSSAVKYICDWIARSNLTSQMDKALVWAAQEFDTHQIVERILAAAPTSQDDDMNLKQANWGPVEWAAYKALPKILLLLLSNSRPGSIDQQTIKSARKANEDADSTEKKKLENTIKPMKSRKVFGKDAIDHTTSSKTKDRTLINDILQNSGFLQVNSDSHLKEDLKADDAGITISRDYNASIVHIHKGEGESAALRRVRTVKKVIYGEGPEKLMSEANDTLKDIIEKTFPVESAKPFEKSMYKTESPKVAWIHLPVTNVAWMNDLLTVILRNEKYTPSDESGIREFLKQSWVEVPDRISDSRTMRPILVDKPQDIKLIEENANGRVSAASASAIYVPYLSFSSHWMDVKKDKYLGRRKRLAKAYEKSTVHGFPTLDEWYYHFGEGKSSEEEMRERNKTQVVTKSLNDGLPKTPHWRLLRVNQLWIWTIGDKWLISATNDPVEGSEDQLCEGFLENLDKLVRARGSMLQPGSSKELSRMIVDYCVGYYDRRPPVVKKRLADESGVKYEKTSIREIFFNAINKLGMQRTDLINKFALFSDNRDRDEKAPVRQRLFDRIKEYLTRATPLPDTGDKEKRRVSTFSEMRKASDDAENLSCEIKDVQDELSMLRSVVYYQQTVKEGLASACKDAVTEGYTPKYILDDLAEMDKLAGRIDSGIDSARALRQGQESVKQGRIFMIFTVVTVVFLPLSFLSSLFALDVETFQKAPGWAFAVIFAVSFVVSTPLAYQAYKEEIRELLTKVWKSVKEQLISLWARFGSKIPDNQAKGIGGVPHNHTEVHQAQASEVLQTSETVEGPEATSAILRKKSRKGRSGFWDKAVQAFHSGPRARRSNSGTPEDLELNPLGNRD